jgi:hypothetical protein
MEGFKGKGIIPYAISIQNEPGHEDPTYPTARFTVSTEAQIGRILKLLMKANGWSNTKLIGMQISPLNLRCRANHVEKDTTITGMGLRLTLSS